MASGRTVTMGRLIDADRLLEILEREEKYHSDFPQRADGVRDAIMDVISAPTVDVVPVMRGEWIEENTRPRSGVFYCSSCHRTCYDLQPTRLKGWTKRCRYTFCPNCGADMRKDGDWNDRPD